MIRRSPGSGGTTSPSGVDDFCFESLRRLLAASSRVEQADRRTRPRLSDSLDAEASCWLPLGRQRSTPADRAYCQSSRRDWCDRRSRGGRVVVADGGCLPTLRIGWAWSIHTTLLVLVGGNRDFSAVDASASAPAAACWPRGRRLTPAGRGCAPGRQGDRGARGSGQKRSRGPRHRFATTRRPPWRTPRDFFAQPERAQSVAHGFTHGKQRRVDTGPSRADGVGAVIGGWRLWSAGGRADGGYPPGLLVGSVERERPALGELGRSRLASGHDRGGVAILEVAPAGELDVDRHRRGL